MLRFFRLLRRKLLKEGHIRKYFWYALGEILLVMIGILLALQVNNWNEERRIESKAIKYHERLVEDLNFFISETEQTIGRSSRIRDVILESIEFLDSKNLPENEILTLELAVRYYYQYPFRNPSLSTLEEMRSNGDLSLITNLELRNKLIEFENEIESIDEIFLSIGGHIQSNVSYVDQYVRSIPDTSKKSINTRRDIVMVDFESMKNDERLINYFSRFASQWDSHMHFSMNLNQMAVILRDDLIQELEEVN